MRFSAFRHTRRMRWAKILVEACVIVTSWLLVITFACENGADPVERLYCWRLFGPLVLLRLAAHFAVTRSRLQWRCAGLSSIRTTAWAVTVGSLAVLAYAWASGILPYVAGLLPLEWLLTLNLLVGVQVATRIGWRVLRSRRLPARNRRRVLIIGAGAAGQQVVRDLREDPASTLEPVAFLDDDERTWGRIIHGIPVVGPVQAVPAVFLARRCQQILIAIPSLSTKSLRNIVRQCAGVEGDITMLPRLDQILSSDPLRSLIRKVNLDELLERAPVAMDVEVIARYTSGQRILVTGGGGSIGSELCRQLARMDPAELGLLGHGENSLYWIQQELRAEFNRAPLTYLADIQDLGRLEAVFRQFRPTVVFHAAAHKHVPMMESNPSEAVKNNILGTRNLAELAIRHGVGVFVMISTDKAVNPTSVMGATKRVAEMVVQALGREEQGATDSAAEDALRDLLGAPDQTARTRFATVRFGNVLGSRGSVVPLMQRQIRRGGPVTVTHPDMVRFFMTVPEAAQLVLEAGAQAHAGEIYILDMGRPVRILDLAENLIRLSGLVPGKDIQIRFTGMRPGEKLFEEVLTDEEGLSFTRNERILVARPEAIEWATLSATVDALERAAKDGDDEAVIALLHRAVPTFHSPARALPPAFPMPPAPPSGRATLSTPS